MRAILAKVLLPLHTDIEEHLPDKRRETYKIDEWLGLYVIAKLKSEGGSELFWNSRITKDSNQRLTEMK